MRKTTGCLAWVAASVTGLILLVVVGLHEWRADFYRDMLPMDMAGSRIVYSKIRDYGFGPGGQSVGLVVFELKRGAGETRDLRGADWRPTPITPLWTGHGEHSCGREPGIGAFIDYADFRCQVRREVILEVNDLLAQPGSWVAVGPHSRLFIVAPAQNRVVLVFNG